MQGGIIGQDQDQDQDIPRIMSFTGPGTADEPLSKASKKKSKRDPSPLTRMGSSLLRPFKGLSKLRTSRSSDKDGKLQGQSRAASHTGSLASRASSASTQDAAGPSRLNSASLQNQIQTMQSGRSALEPSDSFQFRRTSTDDAPDLAAEPSFAQDLPQNSRSAQAGGTSQVQAPVLSSKAAVVPATGASIKPGQQPSSLSSGGLQPKVSGLAADTPAPASDSDDEFDYDFSQPAASQRSTAPPSSAALLQPKVTSTSSLQGESASSNAVNVKGGSAGAGLQAQGTIDSSLAGGSSMHAAGTASQQRPASFSVEPGKFRPQRSRAEKPQVAIATASVYSPLESGAATSPTMRGNTHGDSREGTLEAEDQPELVIQAGQAPAAGTEQARKDEQGGTEVSHCSGQTHSSSEAQAAKDAQLLAGGLSRQETNTDAHGSTDRQGGHGEQPGAPHGGPVHSALTGHGFLDDGDDSSSPSLSSASSAASSEFDILEAAPDESIQLSSLSLPASPIQPQAQPHTVQRSAYSDTPILGPGTSMHRQPGNAVKAASASEGSQSLGAMLSHRGVFGDGGQQAQSQGPALPASPRRGFSDKPILAVYSRRPSADEEASQAKESGSQTQLSDPVLQNKVAYHSLTVSGMFSLPVVPSRQATGKACELLLKASVKALNACPCLQAVYPCMALHPP